VRLAHQRNVPTHPIAAKHIVSLLTWLRRHVGPGYFNQKGQVLPAHLYGSGLAMTFAIVYGLLYVLWQPGSIGASPVPALVYLLIIATLATWMLAAVAFCLDRHHLPTLLPILLLSLAVWTVSKSDHYFTIHDMGSPEVAVSLQTPQQIAAGRTHPLLTVVAVDGGGIQAAAWATEALTGIQARWPEFHQSTRFISSISGGSVGTMYFVASLRPDRSPNSSELESVRMRAQQGSLNEAARGLAYPDLWRVFVPIPGFFRFEKDRG
jgi:hypothetical protein